MSRREERQQISGENPRHRVYTYRAAHGTTGVWKGKCMCGDEFNSMAEIQHHIDIVNVEDGGPWK